MIISKALDLGSKVFFNNQENQKFGIISGHNENYFDPHAPAI